MTKALNYLLAVLCCSITLNLAAQTTIGIQDFETVPATPTLTYTPSGTGNAVVTGATGFPVTPNFGVGGGFGFRVNNGNTTLITNAVSTVGYTGISLDFRLASLSVNNTNGADGGDSIRVYVSPDNGVTWYFQTKVIGNNNARWSYDGATGNATRAYVANNTFTPFTPVSGGTLTGASAWSTVEVTGLPAVTQLRVRILFVNDNANEFWAIDNIRIRGTAAAGAEIDLQGNGVSIGDGDGSPSLADHTDFGDAMVTGGTVVRTFTIANVGGSALNLTGAPLVQVTGTHAADFTVTALPTTPVAAINGTTTFQVTFDPSAGGTRNATLTILSDDADEGTYDFAITGNGCAAPTTQATFGTLTPTGNQITVNFNAGNGVGRVVKINTVNTFTDPTDGLGYTGNPVYGGAGEQIVFAGAGTSVVVTGLNSGTQYFFSIWENNCSGATSVYNASENTANATTLPNNATAFTVTCKTNTTMTFTWTSPVGGFDGVMLVVREGAAPHSVNALDGATQPFNTDYNIAPTFGGTTPFSRVVFKTPSATTCTITGLTAGLSYEFSLHTYSGAAWSTGTGTTQTAVLNPVTGALASAGNAQATVSWTNPGLSCYDEILVVASAVAAFPTPVTGTTPNTVYGAGTPVAPGFSVYSNTGNNVTVTGLTNNTPYYFTIFVRKGLEWNAGTQVTATPSNATVLGQGDLLVVAINTALSTAIGQLANNDDEYCFMAMQDINTNTSLDFTDNGYERVNAGQFGNTEGTLRFTRTGATIPAGTTICIRGNGYQQSHFDIFVCGVQDDGNWTVTNLNGGTNALNLGSSGDQLWIMQNGIWTNPNTAAHNSEYLSNYIWGWTGDGYKNNIGNQAPTWTTSGSRLLPGMTCFHSDLTGVANVNKVKYTGPMTATNRFGWLARVRNTANWTGFATNVAYDAGINYNGSCINFPISTCPSNIVANATGGQCGAVVTYASVPTDACGTGTITYSQISGSTFPVGNTTVTITTNEGNGNTSTCTFMVTVNDNQVPIIFCPANFIVNGPAQFTLADYTAGTATDNCPGVIVSQSPIPGTVIMGYSVHLISLTATDANGNTNSCGFSIELAPCGPAGVIFVDDNAVGSNNGGSWNDAYTSLQSALSAAVAGNEIWVKEGTYKPTNTNDRSIQFDLKAGVHIYGGFSQAATCATPFVNRNPSSFATILSGDIGVIGDNTDNTMNLVRALNIGTDAVLDGFTMRDAYSIYPNRPAPVIINADNGAGPVVVSSPTFANCVFTDNYNISKGGAVYIRAIGGSTASPTFNNCAFTDNEASADGGAIFAMAKFSSFLNPTFAGCIFTGNTTGGSGGAVYQWLYAYGNSVLTFDDCTFSNNYAGEDGGAIWNYGLKSASTLNLNDCTLDGNSATRGGGIFQTYTTSIATVNLTGCDFDGNIASGDGGCIYIFGDKGNVDLTTVSQTMFANNTSSRGGAVFLYNLGGGNANPNGTANFENCVFHHNLSSTYGGALGVWARAYSHYNTGLNSCSFHANQAATFGGAVSNYISNAGTISTMTLQNCLVWGNPSSAGQAFYVQNPGATVNANDCLLDNPTCSANKTGTGTFNCTGNISGDPLFVDGANGDLHLMVGSPAIDAGGPGAMVDFDGASRPVGGGFDMGAFEYGGIVPRLVQAGNNENLPSSPVSMQLIPNPTNGIFTVQFGQEVTGRVEILDMQGRLVTSVSQNRKNSLELSLGGRSSGIYIVRLITDSEIVVKQIILN